MKLDMPFGSQKINWNLKIMKATTLYRHLEKDFINPKLSDDWARHMGSIEEFLTDNFKNRSMGLVCDFADEVDKVYTAVFPSKRVMDSSLNENSQNAMLFVHHPSIWDITKPGGFFQMDKTSLQKFRDRKISIYNLHVPLDNYGTYSTSVTFAKALGIEIEKPFGKYFGALCGIFGTTPKDRVLGLREKFEKAVGHKVGLYKYGETSIRNKKVAVVAGGGNTVEILEEIINEGANTLLTGITANNNYSKATHEFAKRNGINLLGGTHYSTEKFACIAMTGYFKKLGLASEFIEDFPMLKDI